MNATRTTATNPFENFVALLLQEPLRTHLAFAEQFLEEPMLEDMGIDEEDTVPTMVLSSENRDGAFGFS